MKKVIKLTASMDGAVVYVNPYRFTVFRETERIRCVFFGKQSITVEESLERVKKLIDKPEFIEFCMIAPKAGRLLIKANQISEWHEEDGGVFLRILEKGLIVQGTLGEVTAKIEKALEAGD